MTYTQILARWVGAVIFWVSCIGALLETIHVLAANDLSTGKAILLAPFVVLVLAIQVWLCTVLASLVVWIIVGPIEWMLRLTIKRARAV